MERAVRPRYRIGERERLRLRDWRGQRFILRTDVSQFYSSLYTHSIPWALEGKRYAKANIGQTTSDQLDRAMRNACDGQTVGVPIGPDTSFLAAEIVMAAVDARLESKIALRGHRYIDDYELAFTTRSAAEEAQAVVEDALAEYELAINPTKTTILELPQPFHESWAHQISAYPIRTTKRSHTLADLIALFSVAASLSRRTAGPLKHALFRSMHVDIEDQVLWHAFQNLVWSAVSAEPTTMPTALDVLASKTDETDLEIDKEAATELVESQILMHAPVRNASEVAWALWAAVALELKLSSAAAGAVTAMEDDFVALLALHADSRGLFVGDLDKDPWDQLVDYDAVLSGPHWLLAYESSVRGWLAAADRRVRKNSFFNVLRRRSVRFYDTDPERSPFTGPAGPLPGGLVPDEYI